MIFMKIMQTIIFNACGPTGLSQLGSSQFNNEPESLTGSSQKKKNPTSLIEIIFVTRNSRNLLSQFSQLVDFQGLEQAQRAEGEKAESPHDQCLVSQHLRKLPRTKTTQEIRIAGQCFQILKQLAYASSQQIARLQTMRTSWQSLHRHYNENIYIHISL